MVGHVMGHSGSFEGARCPYRGSQERFLVRSASPRRENDGGERQNLCKAKMAKKGPRAYEHADVVGGKAAGVRSDRGGKLWGGKDWPYSSRESGGKGVVRVGTRKTENGNSLEEKWGNYLRAYFGEGRGGAIKDEMIGLCDG